MTRIRITRDSSDNVHFETVSVVDTDNVFFLNLDPAAAHWPTIASNQLGPAPSPPSSQCFPQAQYGCQIAGHGNEQGFINIVPQLAAVGNSPVTLAAATKDQPIADQQVVTGGMSPYAISGQMFEVRDPAGALIQSGAGIGPGLQLIPKADDTGVFVSGTPTLSGTYNFTFTVDDGMGENLQQVQYEMTVA